jgi:hypothetical protein
LILDLLENVFIFRRTENIMSCEHNFFFKDGFYICELCGLQIDESSFIESFSTTQQKSIEKNSESTEYKDFL